MIACGVSARPAPQEPPPLTPMPSLLQDFVGMIRPATCLQAVSALVIGDLALLSSAAPPGGLARGAVELRPLCWAAASIYLSYGMGMAVNDVADAALDARSDEKRGRPVAAGRISPAAARAYCGVLGAASLACAARASCGGSGAFVVFTASNLLVMVGYALGLQRLLGVKNALCGWLAVSPLLGAALLPGASAAAAAGRLGWLAAAGFPLQARGERERAAHQGWRFEELDRRSLVHPRIRTNRRGKTTRDHGLWGRSARPRPTHTPLVSSSAGPRAAGRARDPEGRRGRGDRPRAEADRAARVRRRAGAAHGARARRDRARRDGRDTALLAHLLEVVVVAVVVTACRVRHRFWTVPCVTASWWWRAMLGIAPELCQAPHHRGGGVPC